MTFVDISAMRAYIFTRTSVTRQCL